MGLPAHSNEVAEKPAEEVRRGPLEICQECQECLVCQVPPAVVGELAGEAANAPSGM